MSALQLQTSTLRKQILLRRTERRTAFGPSHIVYVHSGSGWLTKRFVVPWVASGVRLIDRKMKWPCDKNNFGMDIKRLLFSSTSRSAGKNKGGDGRSSNSRKAFWRVGVKVIKYIRIPALILSVYGFGYRQGIIDYSRDPSLMEDEMLTSVLAGVGCHDRSKIRVAKDGDWKSKLVVTNEGDALLRRVSVVGEKIIKVGKRFVDEELKKIIQQRVEQLPAQEALDEEDALQALYQDEEVEKWALAQRRLAGKWSFILIESPVPNAFVSEILPQRVFITTSMIHSFIENDDEMGLVLGHELSHLILGHTSERSSFETSMMTLEVLLLSIDPTEGMLSLGVMSLLATIRKLLVASQSRDNEREADELGIKLAAMACFDTKRASKVFYKMHINDTESGAAILSQKAGKSLLSFVDTHPPSDERHENLLRASEVENMKKYEDTTCASIRKIFMDMLKATSSENGQVKEKS